MMLIGYGNNNTLLIGLVESNIEELKQGLTQTYEGVRMLVKDVIIVYGRDKEHLISQLEEAGVAVTEEMKRMYRKGERTDRPRRSS